MVGFMRFYVVSSSKESAEFAERMSSRMIRFFREAIRGQILIDRQCTTNGGENIALTPDITVSITAKADLAPADFPQPVLQIEFFSNLPWVLDGQPDSKL